MCWTGFPYREKLSANSGSLSAVWMTVAWSVPTTLASSGSWPWPGQVGHAGRCQGAGLRLGIAPDGRPVHAPVQRQHGHVVLVQKPQLPASGTGNVGHPTQELHQHPRLAEIPGCRAVVQHSSGQPSLQALQVHAAFGFNQAGRLPVAAMSIASTRDPTTPVPARAGTATSTRRSFRLAQAGIPWARPWVAAWSGTIGSICGTGRSPMLPDPGSYLCGRRRVHHIRIGDAGE